MSEQKEELNAVHAQYCQAPEPEKSKLWMKLLKLIERRTKGTCYNKNIRESEDVVQVVLKGTMLNLNSYEGRNGASFSSWVDGIIRNVCADAISKIIKHKNELSLTDENGEISELPELTAQSPEMAAVLRVDREKLLAGFEESQRKVIEMYLEGNTSLEIARETGLTGVAVRKRLSRL